MSENFIKSNIAILKSLNENYINYKKELDNIMNNTKGEYSNLVEIFKQIKQKKNHLAYFFLFQQYKNWINPLISYDNIVTFNKFASSSNNIYIIKKPNKNISFPLEEKFFILWYFYLLYNFFHKEYKIKKETNEFRYLLFKTNNIVSSLYKNKDLSIKHIINFLDIYLLSFEYFAYNQTFFNLPPKLQKIKKIFFFSKYFDLLKKISIISLQSKYYNDFELILNYLKNIMNNTELKDEINNIILINNNIIQDLMSSILEQIDKINLEKKFPQYKEELIKFYVNFLQFKYKKSNVFSYFMDISRHSFERLYNFKYNKDLIMKDITLNSYNTSLLNELFLAEEKNIEDQMAQSFYFEHQKSVISFKIPDIKINNVILFFSFQIGKEEKNSNINNNELPLIVLKNKGNGVYKIFFKIFLKKIKNVEETTYYNLCISQPNNTIIINNDSDNFNIVNGNIYYCAILLEDKKIITFLNSKNQQKDNSINFLTKENNITPNKENQSIIFTLGNDDNFSFYKGKIGPLIMIEAPQKKNIINKDIKMFISSVLLLNDKYKDFLITKSDLLNYYSFDLREYYEQKSIYYQSDPSQKIQEKPDIKGLFNCLLYLNPYSFEFLENKTEDITKSKNIPVISTICEKNIEYIIIKLNISIINNDNSKKLFIMDNGINLICLQIEYYNQFAKYFLRKNNKEKIYNNKELDNIINEIKIGLRKNLLILHYYCHYKHLYTFYRKIFSTLYECLLNLNKISPIMDDDIFNELCSLRDIYKTIILKNKSFFSYFNSKDLIQIYNKDYKEIVNDNNNNQYELFILKNISYYIGIIEILLTPDFYIDSKREINNALLDKLFNNLLLNNNFINFDETNETGESFNIFFYKNIFYKLLNFISILCTDFDKKENKEDQNQNIINDKNNKSQSIIGLLILNFHLLINILNIKNNDVSNDYIQEIFRFVFRNNRSNYYVIYSYLYCIYHFSEVRNIFIFDEKQINQLESFLSELQTDINNKDEYKQKIEIFLISILIEYMISNPNKKFLINKNIIENYIHNKGMTKELFTQMKYIFNKYFLNDLNIENNTNKNIIKDSMQYFQNLFAILIYVLKVIKLNKLKYDEKDIIENINDIMDILYMTEKEIKNVINSNLINYQIISYLINFLIFANLAMNDNELNFLFNKKKFFDRINGIFNLCYISTLMHCNIYITINQKNSPENKETKILISEIFFDLFKTHLEQIFEKYNSSEMKEDINTNNDLVFIDYFLKTIDNKYIVKFNYSNYNLKKNNIDDEYKTIFFLSDFLKLYSSEKKFSKNYQKNNVISQRGKFYKDMKDIVNAIYENNKDNVFDFYFTSYYLFEVTNLKNRINLYLKNEKVLKHQDLVKKLNELLNLLSNFNIHILNDHLRLNNFYKNFYFRKIQNNNYNLKNVLKLIQTSIFDKKNKNKIDANSCITEIEKQLSNFEDVTEKIIEEKKDNISNEILLINIDNNINNNIENKKKEKDEKNDDNDEIPLLELKNELFSHIIFDDINKEYIKNIKKELMKNIFGIYFEESFYNNKTFQKMKNYYLNIYDDTKSETKLLNYPSKIKSFTNGLDIPLFLKEDNKFFITKLFPITHLYFHKYMNKHNILNESIILLKKNIKIPYNILNNKEEKNDFECELVKMDKTYFGHIINSTKDEYILFKEKKFKLVENEDNLKEEIGNRIFSLSSLELVITKGEKLAKAEAKNNLLDEDIFPNEELNYDKTVLIFYSDIEEIIERRYFYYWQGIEIFLKNGKSYIFNMLTEENYNNVKNILKTIKNIFFREKDFFKKSLISESWKNSILNTYEYLLFINKYSSRSLNDTSQYYVFPWILLEFNNLLEINKNQSEIYEYLIKQNEDIIEATLNKNKDEDEDEEEEEEDKRNNNDKEGKNDIIMEYYKNLRILKYPVSVQRPKNIKNKILKYNDENEKFKHHFGTHYSTNSYVYYYLMRLEPFTSLLVILQSYAQENPDRMLLNLKDTLKIIDTGNDNRELLPEFYSKIEFFININCVYFGIKKNEQLVDDINCIWKDDNNYNYLSVYIKFIIEHQKLLNSKIIDVNIGKWIDNVFGVEQLPSEDKREKSLNIFFKTAYGEYIDLHKKLIKHIEKDINKAGKKIATNINLIVSFGQTPQKIFFEHHKGRNKNSQKINNDLNKQKEEEDLVNSDDEKIGDDFIEEFTNKEMKNEDNQNYIKIYGDYFEINSLLGKIFILNRSSEISIIDSNYYSYFNPNNYKFKEYMKSYKLPNIYCFDTVKNDKNYKYDIKYAFSPFSLNFNNSISYLYSSQYIQNIKIDKSHSKEYNIPKSFKFITCKHLDNSFKIHSLSEKKETKQIDIFSYICEDFVMCCKTITYNSFIIGLKNGKLIKAFIHETKPQIIKGKSKENSNTIYQITFDNYIQGHKGSINMIEIYKKYGIIITGGDDKKLYIRKLYDFELLTCIQLKSKFVIVMAKISPKNFLYILCCNKKKENEQYIIFGYTLSGLKFAKSAYSSYTNLDFTSNGNIISFNDKQNIIDILEAHNLNKININKNDKDYENYTQIQNKIKSSIWIQYDDFQKYYGFERRSISFLTNDSSKKCYFKTLKATDISYFE